MAALRAWGRSGWRPGPGSATVPSESDTVTLTLRPQARAWHSGLALTGRPPGPGHDSESRGSLSARASRGGSLSAAAAGAAAHPAAGHSVIVAVIVTDSDHGPARVTPNNGC